MSYLLVASALAGSVPLPSPQPGLPDRLSGVHFGLGVGLGFYTQTQTLGEAVYSTVSVSSYTSMRLRLGKRFALEPTFRIGRSGSREANEEETSVEEGHTDYYAVGLRLRPLLASVDRVDLVGVVGVGHARYWTEYVTNVDTDNESRTTSFSANTTTEVGIALEYWITPRLSISGEFATNVFGASVYTREPSVTRVTEYDLTFNPSGDMVFHLYF